jgi:hypothetical protein
LRIDARARAWGHGKNTCAGVIRDRDVRAEIRNEIRNEIGWHLGWKIRRRVQGHISIHWTIRGAVDNRVGDCIGDRTDGCVGRAIKPGTVQDRIANLGASVHTGTVRGKLVRAKILAKIVCERLIGWGVRRAVLASRSVYR